jgi:hypothetical protein
MNFAAQLGVVNFIFVIIKIISSRQVFVFPLNQLSGKKSDKNFFSLSGFNCTFEMNGSTI